MDTLLRCVGPPWFNKYMMMNKETKEAFNRAAKQAERDFSDALYFKDFDKAPTAEEAYAQAIADMRTLLFNYDC